MEIILCALKCEAQALSQYIKNKDVKIECCGVGAKNLSSIKNLGPNDHITNIGVCGGKDVENIYLINKINTKKPAYPDILIDSSIKQKEITTLNCLADKKMIEQNTNMLFDQESAVIWNEASKYLGPHQISFLKIVSDDGLDGKKISKDYIRKLIDDKIEQIETFIKNNLSLFSKPSNQTENIDVSKYSQMLKCSVSMENRLRQQLKYANIKNIDVDKYFDKLNKNGEIPVEHKKNGIKLLDILDDFLINK